MGCNDQTIELVVGVVGKREHHPVLTALTRADFNAANDAVGAGRGGDLDAVGVAVLMFEHRGQVDRRHVAADGDSVDRPCRRGRNNHEAQQERCQAPDQTQCRFSAVNTSAAHYAGAPG